MLCLIFSTEKSEDFCLRLKVEIVLWTIHLKSEEEEGFFFFPFVITKCFCNPRCSETELRPVCIVLVLKTGTAEPRRCSAVDAETCVSPVMHTSVGENP